MAISSFRRGLEEASSNYADIIEARPKSSPKREGYATGVPIGGATEINPGQNVTAGTLDRPTFMQQLLQAYLACPWSSASIDTIARTATAGGLEVIYDGGVTGDQKAPEATLEVKKVQQLLKYVNPHDDIRQLMRAVITDLLIFGDSFTEVVWVMGEPVALYPLDPTTMTVLSDEHGVIKGYVQKTPTNRTARFKPNEVIHVKFDSPGDTLYGVSPTQKNILPITSWLFTAALVKETMKRGDPARIHVDWPLALPESEMKRLQQQYATRNLGARNIGNLFETKGGAQVHEMGINQLNNWLNTLQQRRDEILSGYGVPPSKVGVIEAGNLGGGTGTQQDKTFRVNTVGPIQELVLEKFSFALMYQAYGIEDWAIKFGVVDWRDDEVIEQIRDQRIRNGSWTLNKARADIGEPPVKGGDDAVLIDRQNMVLWSDLGELSAANLAVVKAQGIAADASVDAGNDGVRTTGKTKNAPVAPTVNPGSNVSGVTTATAKTKKDRKPSVQAKKPGQTATPLSAPRAPGSTEAEIAARELMESEDNA
jgi:HK97 family phage portal protein